MSDDTKRVLFGSTFVDLLRVLDESYNGFKYTPPLMAHIVLQEHDFLAIHVLGTAMVFTMSCEQLRADGSTTTSTILFSMSIRGHEREEKKGQFIITYIELKMNV